MFTCLGSGVRQNHARQQWAHLPFSFLQVSYCARTLHVVPATIDCGDPSRRQTNCAFEVRKFDSVVCVALLSLSLVRVVAVKLFEVRFVVALLDHVRATTVKVRIDCICGHFLPFESEVGVHSEIEPVQPANDRDQHRACVQTGQLTGAQEEHLSSHQGGSCQGADKLDIRLCNSHAERPPRRPGRCLALHA